MLRRLMLLLVMVSAIQVQAADEERAVAIVNSVCKVCHGADGESSSAIYPRLAGQSAVYISRQLEDFKSGRRKGTMNDIAANLEPDEMVALGKYFSSKPTKSHRALDPDFTAVGKYIYHNGNQWSGVAACASCHGEEGAGTDELPRIAGQHMRYLVSQLREFNERERTYENAIMSSIATKLTPMEIEAVARYLSGI